ncbi:MAG TPA: peptide chain release factor N(5)-glutamine methyltransferase [Gemmatimonadaceae bacterium]
MSLAFGPDLTPHTVSAGSSSSPADRVAASELVARLVARLGQAGVPDARDEARDLVAALLDRPRFWPSLHPDEPVDRDLVAAAEAAAERRAAGAPFAYAAGRAAFRFLTLMVDERVLIPRQETELLVDLVLEARRNHIGDVVADIGTGSGALALALAAEGRFSRIIATDLSSDALSVAEANVRRYAGQVRTPVELRSGAGLAPLAGELCDVLVSNPPYIASGEVCDLPPAVRDWEPITALVSGPDGLAVTRELVAGAPALLRSGGLLALETDCRRARDVADLVAATGVFDQVMVHRDLTGRDRFVLATRC